MPVRRPTAVKKLGPTSDRPTPPCGEIRGRVTEASRAPAGRGEGATGFGQFEPVASAERDERDPEHGTVDVWPEDDGDGQVPPTVAHQPTLKRSLEPNPRELAFGDRSKERIDLVEPPLGGIEIAADFENVINDAVDVSIDQRVADLAQSVRP